MVLGLGEKKIKGECDWDKEKNLPFCKLEEVDKENNVLNSAKGYVGMNEDGEVNVIPPVTWSNNKMREKLFKIVPTAWKVVEGELVPVKKEFELKER